MPKIIIETANGPVSQSNPLPVTSAGGGGGDASAANQTTLNTEVGIVTETAPASDTASSGLNGRLQRIAQRVTSLIALLPASLGQKAKTASLAVTLASDEDLLATNGATGDAAVAAGATGSLSAKLRSISRDIVANIVLAAGENHIGQVSGHSAPITITPTVSTSPAYSSGDDVGGKMTLANAVRVSGGTGWLASLQISDISNNKFSGTLLVFNADLTTTYTDNGAAGLSSADIVKIVAQIPISSGDWTTINNRAIANPLFNPKQVKAASGTSLYAILVVTATPTFAAATDLQLIFGFAQD